MEAQFVIHSPEGKFWNRGQRTIAFASEKEATEYAVAKGLESFGIAQIHGKDYDGGWIVSLALAALSDSCFDSLPALGIE